MLNIVGRPRKVCDGWTRREILQAGGAGLLGLSLPKLLAAESQQPAGARAARAKSVIFLFLFGGPSQLETFDLKPDAPSTIRGPFRPIASRTPELRISEVMPKLAQISDRFCVVRTMTHKYNDHSSAGHYIQTGRPWHVPIGGGFNATENDWPTYGSVVDYLDERAGGAARDMPGFVYLPNRLGHIQTYSTKLDRPGQYAGWLGRGYDPLATAIGKRNDNDNPYFRDCTDEELDFRIQGLALERRLDARPPARATLAGRSVRPSAPRGRSRQSGPGGGRVRSFSSAGADAGELRKSPPGARHSAGALGHARSLRTPPVRAVDLARAAAGRGGHPLCDRGLGRPRRLQLGLAHQQRRRAEAPDPWARPGAVGASDRSGRPRAARRDVGGDGGRDGRTPKPSGNWGRGHWSTLFPAVLAGAGVRGGMVYGSSDKDAAYAVDHPTSPEDLAATIFDRLGIDPHLRIHDVQGRPVPLVEGGQVIREILT